MFSMTTVKLNNLYIKIENLKYKLYFTIKIEKVVRSANIIFFHTDFVDFT